MKPVKTTPLHPLFSRAGVTFQNIDGWQVAPELTDGGGVTLNDLSHHGLIRVEGAHAAHLFGEAACAVGDAVAFEAGWLARIRSDLFLVYTGKQQTTAVAEKLRERAAATPHLITITDLTHGQAKIFVSGPQASSLLSRVCGLDFHDSQIPSGSIRRSSVAKTAQTILRLDKEGVPGYLIVGDRSFAVYLWQTLIAAGHDLELTAVNS